MVASMKQDGMKKGGAAGNYTGGTRPTGGRIAKADGGDIKDDSPKTPTRYNVINRKTGEVVGSAGSLQRARRAVDRHDLNYGTAIHSVRPVFEDREERARGGRAKGKTNIIISINPGAGAAQQQGMMPPGNLPPGAGGRPGAGAMPVPVAGPPGAGAPPPMPMPVPMPMPMGAGGFLFHHFDNAAPIVNAGERIGTTEMTDHVFTFTPPVQGLVGQVEAHCTALPHQQHHKSRHGAEGQARHHPFLLTDTTYLRCAHVHRHLGQPAHQQHGPDGQHQRVDADMGPIIAFQLDGHIGIGQATGGGAVLAGPGWCPQRYLAHNWIA